MHKRTKELPMTQMELIRWFLGEANISPRFLPNASWDWKCEGCETVYHKGEPTFYISKSFTHISAQWCIQCSSELERNGADFLKWLASKLIWDKINTMVCETKPITLPEVSGKREDWKLIGPLTTKSN